METINLGLQIIPKSKTQESYDLVEKAIEVIQESGVKYEVTPFETVMEGPQEKLMEVALHAQQAVFNGGADEVLIFYRIHARKDSGVSMEEKTEKYRV
ncbi:thiamine-binding protein [Litoribacter ruber]|uniref:thiamine-binding protein n=1 Tax=Litoribacter ruber TaxID=702568 RepID=UPI001BD971D1|nr:thiamine-binding protein [Litoribacter ruber]MBT0810859.1 thiamine-binding protein [Litoribacter ruber]